MLIKSTFIFGLRKMTHLPHPFLRKLKCFINFISLRSPQQSCGLGEGQGGSDFCRWSVKCHDDKVPSPGSPTVGRSPLSHSPGFSTLEVAHGSHESQTGVDSQLSWLAGSRNPNPGKPEYLCLKSMEGKSGFSPTHAHSRYLLNE